MSGPALGLTHQGSDLALEWRYGVLARSGFAAGRLIFN